MTTSPASNGVDIIAGDGLKPGETGGAAGTYGAPGLGNDMIDALGGDDFVFGQSGNDTINGGAGNDTIYGGDGIDTAVFAEDFSALAIVKVGATYYISNGTDLDTVTNVEKFSFNGHTVDLSTNPNGLDATQGPHIDSIVDTGPNGDSNLNTLAVSETAVLGDAVATVTASDPNLVAGDVLTFALVDGLGNPYTGPFAIAKTGDGTAVITVNGALDFETLALHGVTVKVTDAHGHSHTQAINIGLLDVNEAPVASTVNLGSVIEDNGRDIAASELLAGMSDVDSVLTASSITNVSVFSGGGSVSDMGGGVWHYTPAPDANGPVVFHYTVTDGTTPVVGTANLTITPVNDAPIATAVTLVPVAEDTPSRLITAAELLDGVTDIDPPTMRYSPHCRSRRATARWSTTSTAPGPTRRRPTTTLA